MVIEWLRKHLPGLDDVLLALGAGCLVASVGWRLGAVYGLGVLGVLALTGGVLLGRAS